MVKNKGELYKSKLIGASSPLSTRPGMSFRNSVIGILEADLCDNRKVTLSERLISKPFGFPVMSDYNSPNCTITVEDNVVNGKVGETFTVDINHGVNSNFVRGVMQSEPSIVQVTLRGGNVVLKLLAEYEGTVTLSFEYENCLTCSVELKLSIEDAEEEPSGGGNGNGGGNGGGNGEGGGNQDNTPITVNKCKGIHTGESTRLRVEGTRTYMPTQAQLDTTASLSVEVSNASVISLINSGAPDFKVTVRGTSIGVSYVKFITTMKDGTTCQRISKFIVYDTNIEPIDEPAPQGYQNKDDGITTGTPSGGEQPNREGRSPTATGGAATMNLITPALLDTMMEGDIIMSLCNFHMTSGCTFDVLVGGELLASNIDIEGGGRHKVVFLNLPDMPSIDNGGKVTIRAKSNKQSEWGIHVMSYQHVKSYIDSVTAYNSSEGDIYNHKIGFAQPVSTSPIITETQTNEITLDF